ncbi:hypothetical protein Q9233_006343 [Columba guinea]|nr:hypothetical protein Q9233_006343 [Columba guinea]
MASKPSTTFDLRSRTSILRRWCFLKRITPFIDTDHPTSQDIPISQRGLPLSGLRDANHIRGNGISEFVGPDGHPAQLYRKEMSTNDFSKSVRVGYYSQAMVLSREDAINKTDLNSFPQGLIDMTMEAGMAKTFQNGP